MYLFNFITWQANPEIFSIGSFSIRWYGLLFALGFIVGQRIISRFFKYNGYDEKMVDSFVIYTVIGTVVGARLGHVFFYGPYFTPEGTGYFDDPISILNLREGGLASHGALVGLLVSTYFFYKNKIKENYLWITDRLVITVALAGCFIRFGNLMNSEIIGKPTNSPTAFIFAKDAALNWEGHFDKVFDDVHFASTGTIRTEANQEYEKMTASLTFKDEFQDEAMCEKYIANTVIPYQTSYNQYNPDRSHITFFENPDNITFTKNDGRLVASFSTYGIPRHPSQLYESISSLFVFVLLFFLMDKSKGKLPDGLSTGIFFIMIFGLRFIYEITKENQVDMENGWTLNMGQLLSIPAVLLGLFLVYNALNQKKKSVE